MQRSPWFKARVEIPIVFRPRRTASYPPSRPLDRHDGPRRFWRGDVQKLPVPWIWWARWQQSEMLSDDDDVSGAGAQCFFMRK